MNEHRNEAQDLPVEFEPWHQRKWVRGLGVLLLMTTTVTIVAYQYIQYMFYRPIQVTRGPWQVLDPGKPVEPLEFEVVEEGNGAVIEPGDLVQVSLLTWSNIANRLVWQDDNRWIWVGFRTEKETSFHSINPQLVSAFVDLREGGGKVFGEAKP
jgi:hypothetical protein